MLAGMVAGIQLRQGNVGPLLEGTVDGQVPVWDDTRQLWFPSSVAILQSDPVYVEAYLEGAGDSLRQAIIDALADNPDAVNFVLPVGSWEWIGSWIGDAEGLRDDLNFWGYGTQIYFDVGGVASGQTIFFNRSPAGLAPALRMGWFGIRMTLLNALTSFFSGAIYVEKATKCSIVDCEFDCTLVAGASSGKMRWTAALFGDANGPDNGGGRDNLFLNTRVTNCQLQGCGAGRSCRNLQIINTIANQANDYVISVVSIKNPALPLVAQAIENVLIDGVTCYDDLGSGCVFVGGDGNTAGEGVGVVRNITVTNVSIAGSRLDDLDFQFIGAVVFVGGVITENISFSNINAQLASNAFNPNPVNCLNIGGSPDQTSWSGLTIENCQFGIVAATNPGEQIVIDGLGVSQVTISNVRCKGPRGFRLVNCDQMSISNVQMDDGSIQISAKSKNLSQIEISNCSITRNSNFLYALYFDHAGGAAHNVSGVSVDGCYLRGHGQEGINVALGGGTMEMLLSTVNVELSRPMSAETVAGIKGAAACIGVPLPTTISVVVPAVLAGQVGYVDVLTAGTRLAGILAATPIAGNPTADLVAAGAGGGFLNCRVSATGTIRCAFVGPLAGGASNFSFWTL
jgi:hypothetical protein